MSDKHSDRRAKAAQARTDAQAGEKRRERTMRIVGAVVVVIVVLGIIGIAVVAKNGSSNGANPTPTATADPNAPLPAGVLAGSDTYAYGVPFNDAANVPVLEIWEDFQCPSCQALEAANGKGIEQLAAEGKVKLIWRPTTFLDGNLKNDSSVRATGAWGCAIDAGKAAEYHNAIYANPPAKEGDGYTDAQLLSFAQTAGITGAELDTFTSCMNAGTYQPWAQNSYQVFVDSNIPGTPMAKLNGTELDVTTVADPAKLAQAVADATKQ